MTHTTRRRLLRTSGALLATGHLAGCLGSLSTGGANETTTVRTSFAVLHDFTRAVAGDEATVENLVPTGQHGHGWEPSARVQRDVLDSDAFVYVAEGFQPWADDALANLRRDRPGVTSVEARHGIDLLPAPGTGHDGGGHGEDDGHGDHGTESEHDHENESGHGSESDHAEESHAHGANNPHFWLDPARAKRAVTNVEVGLAELDDVSVDALAENADRYRKKLDDLDQQFRSQLDGTARNAVLVAGHNAFQYLGERYGFEIHSLTGLAPDDAPSQRDVRRAQDRIDRHGIEYVLAPVFESDRAAKRLVSETDARDHLPITPIPGTTNEWDEKGWGYLDVMEQVNLASLTTALGGT